MPRKWAARGATVVPQRTTGRSDRALELTARPRQLRGRYDPRGTGARAGSGGDRAEVLERPAEKVLAQVEQPGPQRFAIGTRFPTDGRRQSFERANEHRQLEVRGGD